MSGGTDARERFTVEQRVKLSALGLEREVLRRRHGVEAKDRRGTVTGFKSGDPGVLRVQVDPNKTSTKFHWTHWEPADADPPAPPPGALA